MPLQVDRDRYAFLMDAFKDNGQQTMNKISSSDLHSGTLNPKSVKSFSYVDAQQTPAGVYSCLIRINSSRELIRTKCGHGELPCNSTCLPSISFPVKGKHPFNAHSHASNDMVPTLFTVIPAHAAHDFGPQTSQGIAIPSSISIGTDVSAVFVYRVLQDCKYLCTLYTAYYTWYFMLRVFLICLSFLRCRLIPITRFISYLIHLYMCHLDVQVSGPRTNAFSFEYKFMKQLVWTFAKYLTSFYCFAAN